MGNWLTNRVVETMPRRWRRACHANPLNFYYPMPPGGCGKKLGGFNCGRIFKEKLLAIERKIVFGANESLER